MQLCKLHEINRILLIIDEITYLKLFEGRDVFKISVKIYFK